MHTSELRWPAVQQNVSDVAVDLIGAIQRGEERYQELLEAYNYAGATATGFAELLFYGTTDGSNIPSAGEIERAGDIRDAMVAAHAVFTGVDFAALRRMS
jgi:hypothetical protein